MYFGWIDWYIKSIDCVQLVTAIDSAMKIHILLLATCPTIKCDEILCFWVDKQKQSVKDRSF